MNNKKMNELAHLFTGYFLAMVCTHDKEKIFFTYDSYSAIFTGIAAL
jgi:hypothetical protein